MSKRLVKPNIPPDSCDHVDRVIELSEEMSQEEDSDIKEGYYGIIKEEMEMVRTINTQLRTASKFWYDKHKKR